MTTTLLVVITLVVIFNSHGERIKPRDIALQFNESHSKVRPIEDFRLLHVALLIRHTVRAPRAFPTSDTLLKPQLFPRGAERSTR
ncbi:hypothetical protein BIW11_05808, partial [Tropilaelaps mercedesae]